MLYQLNYRSRTPNFTNPDWLDKRPEGAEVLPATCFHHARDQTKIAKIKTLSCSLLRISYFGSRSGLVPTMITTS